VFTAILQTIRERKDEALVLVSLAAVAVSLLTAVIGPAVQMRIARLNVATNILTANRVKWIEAIQSDIATYVALVERTEFLDKSMKELREKFPKMNNKQGDEFNRLHREYEEKTFERNKLGNLIDLRLDVPEEVRRDFIISVNQYAANVRGMSTGSPAQIAALTKLQRNVQAVLNEEWSRVERQAGRRWWRR
jgi:energy-converting hydrogenase Eha subunit G